jgi:Na+/melibiose symporter-like transporter
MGQTTPNTGLAGFFEKRHLVLSAMIGSGSGYGMILLAGQGDWHVIAISSVIAGTSSIAPTPWATHSNPRSSTLTNYTTGERKEGASEP